MIGHFYFRQRALEQELQQMLWKIQFTDIEQTSKRTGSVVGIIIMVRVLNLV